MRTHLQHYRANTALHTHIQAYLCTQISYVGMSGCVFLMHRMLLYLFRCTLYFMLSQLTLERFDCASLGVLIKAFLASLPFVQMNVCMFVCK